jgi:hypothetical protein
MSNRLFIAFSWQQWLQGRATMLRHMYIALSLSLFLYSISKILPSVEIQTLVKEICINVKYLSLHVVLFAYQDSTEYLELIF